MKFLSRHKQLILTISLCTILGILILSISIFNTKYTNNYNLESLDKNTYQYNDEEKTLLNNLGFTDKELEYLSPEEINYFTNVLPYEEKNLSGDQITDSDPNVKFRSNSIYFVQDNKPMIFIKYTLEFPNGIKEREYDLIDLYGVEFSTKAKLETLGEYTYSSLYCEETIEKDGKVESSDYFLNGNVVSPNSSEGILNHELVEFDLPKDYTNFYYENGIKKEKREYTNFVLSVGKAFELDGYLSGFTSSATYIHQKKSFEIDYTKLNYTSSEVTYDGILIGNNSKFDYKKYHSHLHELTDIY